VAYPILIADSDIQYIYTYHENINEINMSSETQDTIKHVTITALYTKEGINILGKPLLLRYLRNCKLRAYSPQTGKVVKYGFILLQKDQRKKKYISSFENLAMNIYKENDFLEIQLDAAWDGIIAWPKLGFKYDNPEKAQKSLWQLWRTYMLHNNNFSEEIKNAIINDYLNFQDIPNIYKEGLGTWLLENKINYTIPMHKEIS